MHISNCPILSHGREFPCRAGHTAVRSIGVPSKGSEAWQVPEWRKLCANVWFEDIPCHHLIQYRTSDVHCAALETDTAFPLSQNKTKLVLTWWTPMKNLILIRHLIPCRYKQMSLGSTVMQPLSKQCCNVHAKQAVTNPCWLQSIHLTHACWNTCQLEVFSAQSQPAQAVANQY